jgi:hypothetical protein
MRIVPVSGWDIRRSLFWPISNLTDPILLLEGFVTFFEI